MLSESKEFQELYAIGLDTRLINCLLVENIDSVEKLSEMKSYEIARIPGIGKSSLQLIERCLKDANKKINPEIKMLDTINSKLIGIDKTINMLCQIMEKICEKQLTNLSSEMHYINTVVCEQYRLLQLIQLEKSPEGILRKINEKVPGFASTIYDLCNKLDEI